MQKLIINADDYGLSLLFNSGIMELAKKGIITSISVMIKREYLNLEELLSLKNVSIGLHLELSAKSTKEEIENQIELFRQKFGKMPSHLDGHQHCHLTFDNIEKVAHVAQKYGLPVRSKVVVDRKFLLEHNIKTSDNFISWHPNKANALLNLLENENKEVCELVCHPGYYDKDAGVLYNESREKELAFLKGAEFKKAASKFKLISYEEL